MARPRSDIEPRVVHAARARFLAEGVDGASLRTIAKDAGTSVGMIFYYFPTKDELFLAVVEEVYAGLLRDLDEILRLASPLRERLRRVSLRLGNAGDDELEVIRLVVREALLSSERLGRLLARFQRGHLPMLLGALADGVERGEVDGTIPLPILLFATLGIIGVPQLVRRVAGEEMRGYPLPTAEATADVASDILFRGVVARRGRPSKNRRPSRKSSTSKRDA